MTRAVVLVMCVLLVGYGLFQARRIIQGPTIEITSPKNGSATSTTLLTVSGTAHNIAFLTVNDAPAFTDTSGRFAVTLSPAEGYTIITVAALDRFGRRAQERVSITTLNYCPV